MSRAFTKEDDAGPELLVVPRPPLPAGVPNYVTPRGLRQLQTEHEKLEHERNALESTDAADRTTRLHALAQRAAELQARLASAELVDPRSQPQDCVRFGAQVRIRHESGTESNYRIVGVDEANASEGLVAFSAPLARALLGKRVGDVALLQTPRSSDELEVLEIGYEADGP
ncbi:MAG TPA: GreA/GreB family elongation factor [Polyangiaceae bacterium]|nr:GreA/GreB family elongation factor [Polyangiaceae bacterium]